MTKECPTRRPGDATVLLAAEEPCLPTGVWNVHDCVYIREAKLLQRAPPINYLGCIIDVACYGISSLEVQFSENDTHEPPLGLMLAYLSPLKAYIAVYS